MSEEVTSTDAPKHGSESTADKARKFAGEALGTAKRFIAGLGARIAGLFQRGK